jgi:SAM-dependent methyltransferase/uncharacterized protein YbaR (Trm112 family)
MITPTNSWIYTVLACPQPDCGGGLMVLGDVSGNSETGRSGLIRCGACEATYPVLAGVPILVARPMEWMASYRESILAALAEVGEADFRAVGVVDAFAQASLPQEPMRFGDDWVAGEGEAEREDWSPPEGPAPGLHQAIAQAAEVGPTEMMLALLGGRVGTVLELGIGSGVLSHGLSQFADRMVIADISLRAVLRTLSSLGGSVECTYEGVVLDADQMRFHEGALDAVMAANLVDLLDDPDNFAAAVHEGLGDEGRLILSTPDPELGIPDGQSMRIDGLLEDAGFSVDQALDGVPWLRQHNARHIEIYYTRLLQASRAASSDMPLVG